MFTKTCRLRGTRTKMPGQVSSCGADLRSASCTIPVDLLVKCLCVFMNHGLVLIRICRSRASITRTKAEALGYSGRRFAKFAGQRRGIN